MKSHLLFHAVNQLSRQLAKQLNFTLQPHGLYSAQWSVLYVLKEKGSLTQKELCDYLAVEAPPMTRTVQRLVKQGYVRQVPGKDRRVKIIELTEKAASEYPVWEKKVAAANEQLVENFPKEDQEQLQQLISKWLKALGKEESK
ncbi:MarR family winged helix-turn-helix transcriptional regulator [Bacillus xiapuensis]|uniref:MarR family winged helix-turn-helix transcriptional regulator n=1 Tax=Bacillus xiapuensis TaxID=2014075 RepID=UPI000C24EDBE|nr:MarR family transcriptional regulator [Bacillus xiapuensis]